jgi:hypothetical protein
VGRRAALAPALAGPEAKCLFIATTSSIILLAVAGARDKVRLSTFPQHAARRDQPCATSVLSMV